jgi:hypothetical protein
VERQPDETTCFGPAHASLSRFFVALKSIGQAPPINFHCERAKICHTFIWAPQFELALPLIWAMRAKLPHKNCLGSPTS